ncbi:glycerophosphodiester phosphodiesterase [Paenibacillus sp. LHD-117]|uniref:glycerophosphodiester phosphodiesterase n=1 Tax=Paenibacillus sp. LHD-117 TaxID=3071412 RepID=UPI0027E1EF6D|nr:glycerophosphodiester phosphodiesterase [Paenibacillus sp. LHD-117]MDQ6419854.1 glycerophosphodiester phosphodiesterase [Paenibacillus sp. LHD-117]
MLRPFGWSVRDFRAIYKKLLVFEYLFMLLTSFAVLPILNYIFNKIMWVLGTGSLLNNDVYRIGYSYEGLTGLIVIGVIASFVLFIEFGVVITIAQKHYFGQNVLISDALWTTLRQAPRLFGFGLVQLVFFLLVLIPFVDSPLSAAFYRLFNVPIFLNKRVFDSSQLMLVLYALLLLAALYTVLRWIFVLHFIVLEGQSITEAIRNSLALTRSKRLRLFFSLFLLNGIVLGVGFALISSISYLPAWLDNNVLKLFTDHYTLTLSTLLAYMFTLSLIPFNIIYLTRLYYDYGQRFGIEAEDRLELKRSPLLGRLEKRITGMLEGVQRKRAVYASLAIIYVCLALLVSYSTNDNLVYAKWGVLVSAHRGDSEAAPENSLQSVRSAIEKGFQSVELDVQLTKDGTAVLHHDYQLLRMAGVKKRVSELTFDQLAKLSIGTYDAPTMPEDNEDAEEGKKGEPEIVRIPLLSEVLAEAQGKIKLLLDLKPYGDGEALVREVVALVDAFEMEEDVYIQSFDSKSLSLIRSLNPDIRIGQILYFALGDLTTLDVDFYTIEQVMLTDQLVDHAHRNGREVWVWTVNSSRNMKEVLKFRIDGIITDYPDRAQTMVELNL